MLSVSLKVALILLLVGCWFPMPYGYYELVRFAGLLGFALLAYDSYARGGPREAIAYAGLALLFQPFAKVALGRSLWELVDGVVALLLVLSLLPGKAPSKGKDRPES